MRSIRRMRLTTTIHRFDRLQHMLSEAPCRATLFRSDKKFRDAFVSECSRLMSDIEVLSLDIFDTLLFRDTSSELTRFHEIADHIAQIVREETGRKVTAEDALVARHLGTLATYRTSTPVSGCREGSLTEIYQTASFILTGSKELTPRLIEAEIKYECQRLERNDLLLQQANEFREQGGTVILVTDMYMHATQVIDLLSHLGVDRSTYDDIFSSGDTKVSKASGGIFRLVEEKMSKVGNKFLHLGDSLRGDYVQPRRNGWHALHLPLSQKDVVKRRIDHDRTATYLSENFGLALSIAAPH